VEPQDQKVRKDEEEEEESRIVLGAPQAPASTGVPRRWSLPTRRPKVRAVSALGSLPRLVPCLAALLLLAAACEDTTQLPHPVAPTPLPAAPAPLPGLDEPAPKLRLPGDTRPTAEAILLHIDPASDRFSGAVDIDVTLGKPRALIWLHGKNMKVSEVTVTPAGGGPVHATWDPRDEASGLAAIRADALIPAGAARVHVAFDAAFEHGQSGLYKVTEGGLPYAFTQFEAITARRAFPCFDEPGFKLPFTTTLVVPGDLVALANTHEVSRVKEGGDVRVTFAPTAPLPSYLVAFAVGQFDVIAAEDSPPNGVRKRPLPVRGVTVKGRGKEIAYALAHTGEIVSTLEQYVGVEYAYDKLDILAIPGKGGAMENPGAVTFAENLLLMDPATASLATLRSYAAVMAHELAHQWTGDLVTMKWWDDTWLNEAFATWLGNKASEAWDPKTHADLAFLRSVQGAMSADALVSARAIRQPIGSIDDIQNAFDTITYQKGGGVLAMFERWAGADKWRLGLHAYLEAHRFGNATADDFLDAESAATGKDVKTAFHTFLDQPGLPLLDVSVSCGKDQATRPVAHLRQSRFLPAGSSGDANQRWQLPVCLRTDLGTECTLLTQAEGDVPLGAGGQCPAWVLPNADGAGYFRFSLASGDLARLRQKGMAKLTTREKMAFGSSLRGGYSRGATPFKDVIAAAAPLAADPEPTVAEEPMGYLVEARDWLDADPARPRVEAYADRLYAPVFARLGWSPRKGEDEQQRALRGSVLWFLALTARDPAVRAEAKRRGLAYIKDGVVHPEAVDPNLAASVLAVLGEDADRATWDAMKSLLHRSVEEVVRARLIWGLSIAKEATLSAAARDLVLDPDVRESEMMRPLAAQLQNPATREAAWTWLKEHFEAVLARLPKRAGAGLVGTGRYFCDEAHAAEVQAFFGPKVQALEGAPRALASTVEDVKLCAARRKAQEPSAREVFGGKR
jgi:aminopeptidase N